MKETPSSQYSLPAKDVLMLEKVGDGATATVFRGMCKNRVVAVKEIRFGGGFNWTREVQVLKQVSHPNIVGFLGVATDCRLGAARLVLEFCHGGTLFDLLHDSDVDLRWAQKEKMALDVARAMQHLHSFEPEIVHRDLKSLNLLLEAPVCSGEDEPLVKLTDFGLARIGGMRQKTGAPGSPSGCLSLQGTGPWIAPEVFAGHSYGRKVDVYSYGMVLYELICRDIPFGVSARDFADKKLGSLVAHGHRPTLAKVPDGCPEVLETLMIDCWAQDPNKRPEFFEVCGILLMDKRRSCQGCQELLSTLDLPQVDFTDSDEDE